MKILLLLFLASPAWACRFDSEDLPLPDNSIVKIHSSVCGASSSWRGTGTLIQANGKAYVLTSDHVVLHGNSWEDQEKVQEKVQEICHTVWNPVIGAMKAKYLTSDWEMGLALLEVPDVEGKSFLKPEQLTCESYPLSHDLMVMGYPADSEILMEDGKGRLIHNSTIPSFLYGVPHMGRIDGTSGEFGMSGGIAAEVTLRGLRTPIGIVSHQVVRGGRPDEVNRNRILFIPITAARDWLLRYFANPEGFQPRFFQDIGVQVDGAAWAVQAGKLFFHLQCYGHGPRPCNVIIGHRPDAVAIEYQEQESWMKQLVDKFEKDRELRSVFIFGNREGMVQNAYVDANYAGLTDFLRRTAKNPVLAALRDLAWVPEKELPPLAERLGAWIRENEKAGTSGLLTSLKAAHFFVSRLENSGDDFRRWDHLNERDFLQLLESYPSDWKALKESEAKKLRRIVEELRKVYLKYLVYTGE
jgi:hypothetical protein